MDHKWLEDLLMLAQERSFSKAAQLRHVTQPQFSRRIRALELWAGTDLVDRSGVPLSLTPAGESLLAAAQRAVEGLADARARIGQARHGQAWITVASGRTLSRTAIPGWLMRMRKSVGDFQLRLQTGSIAEGVTALEQGGVDFLLSYSHPRLRLVLDEQVFEAMPVGSEELLAVSAAGADGKPVHALPGTARRPAPALRYAPTLALARILQDALDRRGEPLHLATAAESDFAESLHELALAGFGVAWLPRSLIAADLRSGRLVSAAKKPQAIPFEIHMFRPRAPRSELADRIWRASLPG
jgi:DNA-binding transcriptional LysR family regulator